MQTFNDSYNRVTNDIFADEEIISKYIDRYVNGDNFIAAELVLQHNCEIRDGADWLRSNWDTNYTVLQFWDNEIVPEDILKTIETNRSRFPNSCHKLYNTTTARGFIQDNFPRRIVDAFDACSHPAMQADYFRLAYLYSRGGLYVDADVELIGPFDRLELGDGSLLVSPMIRGIEAKPDGSWVWYTVENLLAGKIPRNAICYFQNDVLGARPRNEIIRTGLVRGTILIERGKIEGALPRIHWATGPTNLTVAAVTSLIRSAIARNELPRFKIFDRNKCLKISHYKYKLDQRNWKIKQNNDIHQKKS